MQLYWQPHIPQLPHIKILHHKDAVTWHIKMSIFSKQISLLHTPNVNKLWLKRIAVREDGKIINLDFICGCRTLSCTLNSGQADRILQSGHSNWYFFELWAAIVAAAHTAPTHIKHLHNNQVFKCSYSGSRTYRTYCTLKFCTTGTRPHGILQWVFFQANQSASHT